MVTTLMEPEIKPIKVKPELMDELKEFGVVKPEICYNCGNCVAVCGQAKYNSTFPRRIIHMIQLGLEEKLARSIDPWLCYYCGDCTDSCPRDAEPAEIMMGVRRWQIAKYDYTGQARHLYTSTKRLIAEIIIFSLLPVLGLLILHYFGWAEVVTDSVQLNKFAPVMIIWAAALITGGIHAMVLLAGAYHMHKLAMDPNEVKAPVKFSDYVITLKDFIVNFITQKQWISCGKKEVLRWIKHLILVIGYATMFVLIIGLLWWFQTDTIYPITHPQRLIGYIATVILFFATIDIMIGRLRKKDQIHKFSHHSDWMFPVVLFLVTLTGILVNILRIMGLPWPTYIMYTLHLMVTNVMLSTEVGVGKWSHLLYRPLGHYFYAIQTRARQRAGLE